MPLYEYRCEPCRLTFEALAPITSIRGRRECPNCERPARRIMSAPVLGAAAREEHDDFDARARREVPPIPPMARFCGMDDRSAERLAWHKAGRGTEYDDRSAASAEKKKRGAGGAPPRKPAAAAKTAAHPRAHHHS